jgi:hypothetical protein
VFLYFGDAASHVVRARQFIDSQRPGIHNIGTVWLPLPHLILLPLVAIDALFYSGIAGLVVGIPCLVGTSVLLFLLVRKFTGSSPIAFLSGCLFGLNPNLVYMALTPMNELLFMLLVTIGGYALLRWQLEKGEWWALACATAVALAALCRYEAWFIVPFVSLLSGLRGIVLWRNAERAASLRLFTNAGICWAGIASWVWWNFIEYGDPLKFARWTYAVAPGTAEGVLRQPALDAILIFCKALLVIYGPIVLLFVAHAYEPDQTGKGASVLQSAGTLRACRDSCRLRADRSVALELEVRSDSRAVSRGGGGDGLFGVLSQGEFTGRSPHRSRRPACNASCTDRSSFCGRSYV